MIMNITFYYQKFNNKNKIIFKENNLNKIIKIKEEFNK